jgi:hypothetical protein
MPLDIDALSEAQLVELNHRVVERLRFLHQARAHQAMLKFRIGELVWFQAGSGEWVRGVITRYNRNSVSVLTPDGQQWRVAPGFLRKTGAEGPGSDEVSAAALPLALDSKHS